MSIPLTFSDKNILESTVVGPEGSVHYTTSTTHGLMGRKSTTVTAASGLTGIINWRDENFVINGSQRDWDDIREKSGGFFSSDRNWYWVHEIPYNLKYQDWHNEIVATPKEGSIAGTIRFTAPHLHLFSENEPAVIFFPQIMEDEIQKMFVLLAVMQTEIHHEDVVRRRQRAAA